MLNRYLFSNCRTAPLKIPRLWWEMTIPGRSVLQNPQSGSFYSGKICSSFCLAHIFESLRREAEGMLNGRKQKEGDSPGSPGNGVAHLIHEQEVHEQELKIQYLELQKAKNGAAPLDSH